MHTFKCLAVLMSIVMAIVASPAMASDEPQGVVAPDEVEFCLTRPEIQAEVVDRKDVFYNLPGCIMKKQGAQGLDCYDEIPFLGTNSTGMHKLIEAFNYQDAEPFKTFYQTGDFAQRGVNTLEQFCSLTFNEADVAAYTGFGLPADLGASPCCNCAFCQGGTYRYPHIDSNVEDKERAVINQLLKEDGIQADSVNDCVDDDPTCPELTGTEFKEASCSVPLIADLCKLSCGLCD